MANLKFLVEVKDPQNYFEEAAIPFGWYTNEDFKVFLANILAHTRFETTVQKLKS